MGGSVARAAEVTARSRPEPRSFLAYYVLFFVSGFPALIYQIVWQRALFTLYGVNIESVTMVVSVFMLGLGLGSLAGGWLSKLPRMRLLAAYGAIEMAMGAFGAVSLALFHRVGEATAGASVGVTGLVAFTVLLAPTMLMGSTLPLLVEHFVRRTGNVGESVGLLYSVNTLGSGVACLVAAYFLMNALGESGAVRVSAGINLLVGLMALLLQRRDVGELAVAPMATEPGAPGKFPFGWGVVLAGATGFTALGYEIIWYRIYAFTTGGTAPCFAQLLAFYLIGIAYGSFAVRDACKRKLQHDGRRTLATASAVVLAGAIAAFLLGPLVARLVAVMPYEPTFVLVFIAAALMGSAFPLISHAFIDAGGETGSRVSILYLSNIIGSTLGSFLIGFVVFDHWKTRPTSLLLLGVSVVVALALALLSGSVLRRSFVVGCAACLVLALVSKPLYSRLFERLLWKSTYAQGERFTGIVENRSGVITVDKVEAVYGSGAYDGRFNTDLVTDTNLLFRAFAIGGMNRTPRKVLEIGLSTGSWAQVIANDPDVEEVTVVEINPGYLPLIAQHRMVKSLLTNPKVHIVIDDGRRWLVSHPEARFDMVVMNTTWNWRANISNLLSREFAEIVHRHLNPGGVEYFNTTWSAEALATGVAEFPHALRVASFLALSDEPITLDAEKWRTALLRWRMNGAPVLDMSRAADRNKMSELMGWAQGGEGPGAIVESEASLKARLVGVKLITDDNMGTEWRLGQAKEPRASR